ncbi:ERF family protein [Micromonospora sp. STR1s_5]|nr:ERF family protein [Micromonospora sp. STR1s_5]
MSPRSDSIAQLAAALAKAQIELVNPTKTLTGVIDRWGSGGEGQSYRYAPLSAGLEIVRKTLCKYELAVIQTTHVDWDVEMVMLTTTLAHGSGEYMSASWPVCRTVDMSNPKLMGAALTYARRYGLFTLVGIAGEDDLDAPELEPRHARQPNSPAPQPTANGRSLPDGHDEPGEAEPYRSSALSQSPPDRLGPVFERGRKKRRDAGVPRGPRPATNSVEHAIERLSVVETSDALFHWALAALPFRNELTEGSRATLDAAFFEKADELGVDPDILPGLGPPPPVSGSGPPGPTL